MTSTAPACALPGAIQSPGLAATKVAVAAAHTACPATSPVLASTPLGTSAATTGASQRPQRGDRLAGRAVRLAGRARAQQRVDGDGGARQARRREGLGRRPREAVGVRARVAAQLADGREGQHDDLAPALAQEPRRDVAVAAVVALPADDRHRPGAREALHERGQPAAGALHELEALDAGLLDRPPVRRPHPLGVRQPLEPGRERHGAASATAPAVARVWVRETETRTPSWAARSAAAPRRASSGRPAGGHDLDVTRAQDVEPQGLRHRLLGAEPRRQVLRGPRLGGRVGALGLREQPVGAARAGAPARARAGRCPGGRVPPRVDRTRPGGLLDPRSYSTVTVLARFRGWSTLSPRRRAIR